MNQRFLHDDIRRISEQYAENELYKAICTIGLQLENELPQFGLNSEECITEALELLTVIAEKGEAILPELESLWLRKENEYRRHDRRVCDDEIRKAVGIVFGFAVLAVNSSRNRFYRYRLSERLTMVVAGHKWEGWSATLRQIFSVPLPDGWFDTFLSEAQECTAECTEEPTPLCTSGARATSFSDYIINQAESDEIVGIIKQNLKPDNVKQSALVIIGGIEAGKISRDVSAPSIDREFGVKAASVKPHLTHYRYGGYFSEEELEPYKTLFSKK